VCNRLRILTLTLLFAIVPSVMADNPRPSFEIGSSFLWGSATALGLRNGSYDNPISRLVWPVPPSPAVELSVKWPWSAWTSSLVALEAAFPFVAGSMVDEDWNTGAAATDYSYAHSQHQGKMTSHWSARAEQTFSLPGGFQVGLGGLYRWTTWEGWDGNGRYVQNDGQVIDVSFSGLLVSYQQQWYIPYLSGSWTLETRGWKLTPSVRFSPYTWCVDMDHHIYAGAPTTTFIDKIQGGVYAQGGVEAEFQGTQNWSWGVRGGWEMAWGALGETTVIKSSQSSGAVALPYRTISNAGGAWFQETSFTVFVKN